METIKSTGIRYINGMAETRNPEMEGKWNAAMFFFPGDAISDKHLLLIKRSLKN